MTSYGAGVLSTNQSGRHTASTLVQIWKLLSDWWKQPGVSRSGRVLLWRTSVGSETARGKVVPCCADKKKWTAFDEWSWFVCERSRTNSQFSRDGEVLAGWTSCPVVASSESCRPSTTPATSPARPAWRRIGSRYFAFLHFLHFCKFAHRCLNGLQLG